MAKQKNFQRLKLTSVIHYRLPEMFLQSVISWKVANGGLDTGQTLGVYSLCAIVTLLSWVWKGQHCNTRGCGKESAQLYSAATATKLGLSLRKWSQATLESFPSQMDQQATQSFRLKNCFFAEGQRSLPRRTENMDLPVLRPRASVKGKMRVKC